MQRYKIKIEYEGTPFVGWQFQKNGKSIKEFIQKAKYTLNSLYQYQPLNHFDFQYLTSISQNSTFLLN